MNYSFSKECDVLRVGRNIGVVTLFGMQYPYPWSLHTI